jgi:endonuclease III
VKEAGRVPVRVVEANDFVVASVIQQGLGGHAVPLDAPVSRVLRRLRLVDEGEPLDAARASVEHAIPKAKGPAFYELMSAEANTFCLEERPKCGNCPLLDECPTGQELTAKPDPKPRKPR